MTTTDTDLTEQIARVIYGEDPRWGYTQAGDEHGVDWGTLPETIQQAILEMAAAVLPIVAEAVKAGKAEALREAAKEIEGMGVEPWNALTPAIRALRFRADEIEQELTR